MPKAGMKIIMSLFRIKLLGFDRKRRHATSGIPLLLSQLDLRGKTILRK